MTNYFDQALADLKNLFTKAPSPTTQYPMQSLYDPHNDGHRMLVPSSRCALNCQALSIHLPPLGEQRNPTHGSNYLSPPMSATFSPTKYDEASRRQSNSHRQYSLTPPSRPSTSGKISPSSTRGVKITKTLAKDGRGGLSTPNSTDLDTSGTSLQMSSDTHAMIGESNDELSSNAQDSPEGQQLIAGPPGIARRAKAHVPSACVNCKKKHLACETKRPCNRCVQTGKQVANR